MQNVKKKKKEEEIVERIRKRHFVEQVRGVEFGDYLKGSMEEKGRARKGRWRREWKR